MSLKTSFDNALNFVLSRKVIEGQHISPPGQDHISLSTRAIYSKGKWEVYADYQWAAHALPHYNAEHKVIATFGAKDEIAARGLLDQLDIVNNKQVRDTLLRDFKARETVIEAFDGKIAPATQKPAAPAIR